MGAYRAGGAALLASPTVDSAAPGRVLVPCGDGRIVALDLSTGGIIGSIDTGVPITAPVAVSGDGCLVLGFDGVLRSFPIALPIAALTPEDARP